MPLNGMTLVRQILTICACSSLSAGAWANCEVPAAAACDGDVGYASSALHPLQQLWLGFSIQPENTPVRYPATDAWDQFGRDGGLSFDLSDADRWPRTDANPDTITLGSDSEPAFALLLGSVARLRTDGTVALGRGSERSNSPARYAGQWGDILPAAFYSWDDRPDVDLGLSYAGNGRFSTSVGFAEKIGEQNNDPAVVGWFEVRF